MKTLQKSVITLLDRPGLRSILCRLASEYLHRKTGETVRFRFEGQWISDDGRGVIVDSRFNLHSFSRYEEVMKDVFLWNYTPSERDTIVDVGAGIGSEALTLAKWYPTAKIVGVEAHPVTFACFERAARLNEATNVECLQLAASNSEAWLALAEEPSHLSNHLVQSNDGGARVPARRLDEILGERGLRSIDFLKMNIEGAETSALEGLGHLIQRTRHVAISCHDFKYEKTGNTFFRTKADVASILNENGFEIKTRGGDSRAFVRDTLYGSRRDRH